MRHSYNYVILTAAIALALSGYVVVSGIRIGNLPNGTGGTSQPIAGGILDTANSLGGKQSGNDNNSDSPDISPNGNIIAADGNNDADQSSLPPSANFQGISGVRASEDIQVDNVGSNSNTHHGTFSSDGGCTDTAHECFEFVVPESPVGMIALMGSSLAVLGGFAYFRQTKSKTGHHAYGHFFGAIRNVDKYQVVFLSYPSDPIAGSNSTQLNFSILESNNNIYNTYAALTITEKRSGTVVDQLPYKFYEFSNITIPYTFPTPGGYLVTLQTRITGDGKRHSGTFIF